MYIVHILMTEDNYLLIFRKSFETPVSDTLDRYDVVDNIVNKLPEGIMGKILVDMVIQLNKNILLIRHIKS